MQRIIFLPDEKVFLILFNIIKFKCKKHESTGKFTENVNLGLIFFFPALLYVCVSWGYEFQCTQRNRNPIRIKLTIWQETFVQSPFAVWIPRKENYSESFWQVWLDCYLGGGGKKKKSVEDNSWDVSAVSAKEMGRIWEFKDCRLRNIRYKKALAILSVLVYRKRVKRLK